MSERAQKLEELREVIQGQLELLNLTLYVMSQGPTLYKGQASRDWAREHAEAVAQALPCTLSVIQRT